MWYLDVHTTTTGDRRFTKSCRGSSSAETISPFAEDESLFIQFKSWARCDLENLTIKRAAEWVNNKVLAEWTVQDMLSHNIAVAVKLNDVSRWMREAGFKYVAYKKSYYVDRHEAADVIADRNKYLRKKLKTK